MKGKRVLFWILGLIITLAAAIYQKKTGPTYPEKVEFTINDNTFESKLIRTHGGESDAKVLLEINDVAVTAKIHYKHYPEIEGEEYKTADFSKGIKKDKFLFWEFETEGLIAELPHQPPAGKLMYYIEVNSGDETKFLEKENPIVIRFKGAVPAFIMIPHVFFIFFAMFLANVTGLFAIFKIPQFRRYVTVTLLFMLVGGMIFGPIVQKYAFLEFWTGFPRGMDLTDNKTLIAFLAWIVAFIMNRKKENRSSAIVASLVTIIIFSIPHSMFGSELNRETGEVIQGFINFMF